MEDGSQGDYYFKVVWKEEVSKCSYSPVALGGALIKYNPNSKIK